MVIVGPRGQFFEATQSADEPLTESNLASALKRYVWSRRFCNSYR